MFEKYVQDVSENLTVFVLFHFKNHQMFLAQPVYSLRWNTSFHFLKIMVLDVLVFNF